MILPSHLHKEGKSIYAGFWYRLSASSIDFIVVIAIISLINFLSFLTPIGHYLSQTIGLMFTVFYFIISVKWFGGTLGKLLCGICIIRNDGQAIGWSEAILRESVNVLFSIFISIGFIFIINQIGYEMYAKAGFWEKGKLFRIHQPNWHSNMDILYNFWILSELIVLLFNERRKAIHDFIAGTLIIHSKFKIEASNYRDKI